MSRPQNKAVQDDRPSTPDRLEDLRVRYQDGLSLSPNSATPDDVDRLAQLIDAAEDLGETDGLDHAIEVINAVLGRGAPDETAATLHYFAGNAHSALWTAERFASPSDAALTWLWKSPHLEQVVLSYRRAVTHPGFDDLPVLRRCQVLTNLGNTLSTVGLSLDAVVQYDDALTLDPTFGMARGNRGVVEQTLARDLYDPGHQWIFASHARADLATALSESPGTYPLEPGGRRGFERALASLDRRLGQVGTSAVPWKPHGWSLGDSPEEVAYRRWALRHRLFLNPLCDLGPYSIAATDVLVPPPLTLPIHVGPKYHGAFNQLKQGLVSARFLLYEGLTDHETHFSDRDVPLVNTLDYPCYGLAIERVKLAYRAFYGLFDQVAFLLNDFLGLGIPPGAATFRRLWYKGQDPKQLLRPDLVRRPNSALHALFWLSKDLYEKREGFVDALDPDAQRLGDIRNHLEHRYLKVLEHVPDEPPPYSGLHDDLAFPISRRDLEGRALRLAKTARAAIVYTGIAMHADNARQTRDSDALTVPHFTDIYEDSWKRRW